MHEVAEVQETELSLLSPGPVGKTSTIVQSSPSQVMAKGCAGVVQGAISL
jgi:hypothetical protein